MSACTCFPVPEEYWTTHYGAVDPATQVEPNPECLEHFPDNTKPLATNYQASLSFTREGDTMDWDAFFDTVQERAMETLGNAQAELQWRLNMRLQGEDPGQSVNWRGERGLRV